MLASAWDRSIHLLFPGFASKLAHHGLSELARVPTANSLRACPLLIFHGSYIQKQEEDYSKDLQRTGWLSLSAL